MSKSPYEILGISPGATKDEIKKAYRKKARENHPDLNPNDPNASSRMNEINDAYDRLMNPEKYAKERTSSYGGYGSTGGYGGYGGSSSGTGSSGGYGYGTHNTSGGQGSPYGWTTETFSWEDLFGFGFGGGAGSPNDIHPEASISDTAEIRAAINAINSKNYVSAVRIMTNIPSNQRNARWFYIASLANYGAGNTSLAYEQIRRACQMEPGNSTYTSAMRTFQQPGRTYQQQTQRRGYSVRFDPCTVMCCICVAIQCCTLTRAGMGAGARMMMCI
jgi:molecular chaperone DnaJ